MKLNRPGSALVVWFQLIDSRLTPIQQICTIQPNSLHFCSTQLNSEQAKLGGMKLTARLEFLSVPKVLHFKTVRCCCPRSLTPSPFHAPTTSAAHCMHRNRLIAAIKPCSFPTIQAPTCPPHTTHALPSVRTCQHVLPPTGSDKKPLTRGIEPLRPPSTLSLVPSTGLLNPITSRTYRAPYPTHPLATPLQTTPS